MNLDCRYSVKDTGNGYSTRQLYPREDISVMCLILGAYLVENRLIQRRREGRFRPRFTQRTLQEERSDT